MQRRILGAVAFNNLKYRYLILGFYIVLMIVFGYLMVVSEFKMMSIVMFGISLCSIPFALKENIAFKATVFENPKAIEFVHFNNNVKRYELTESDIVKIRVDKWFGNRQPNEFIIIRENVSVLCVKFAGNEQNATKLTNELLHCGVYVVDPYNWY